MAPHLEGQEAIAVGAGRILATGSNAGIEALRSDGTTAIDLGGRRLIPGLIAAVPD